MIRIYWIWNHWDFGIYKRWNSGNPQTCYRFGPVAIYKQGI